jgi:TDG/mug DNA glycosylase family protein
MFVGINPGVRSAMTSHHFAGYSNRFWKLLSVSGLVPERVTCEDEDRLPEWGLGLMLDAFERLRRWTEET